MWRKIFTGKERRKYVRLSAETNVDFKLNEEAADTPWHKGFTRDISPEGVCLVTDAFTKERWEEIVLQKNPLKLFIYFPQYKVEKVSAEAEVQRIDIEAEVVWQHHEEMEGKILCLLGLHFTRIERESQEAIRNYIIDNLIKEYKPV